MGPPFYPDPPDPNYKVPQPSEQLSQVVEPLKLNPEESKPILSEVWESIAGQRTTD